jgi:hypothetical protein
MDCGLKQIWGKLILSKDLKKMENNEFFLKP